MSPLPKLKTTREQLWGILHHGKGRTGHAYEFLLVILLLLSLAILPLEFLPQLASFYNILVIVEVVTTSIFTVEYALHIYAAPTRVHYIFSFYGLVDLFSILPFYTGLFGTQYIRALRLIRLLRFGEIEAAAGEEDAGVMEQDVGIAEGEQIEYVVTRHPIFLAIGSIPSLIAITFVLVIILIFPDPIGISFAASLFLFALIYLWKTWLDFSYDVFYVTSRRLIFQNQYLLGRSVNQVNYNAITNVKPYYPSIISYIFRYGSLIIETPAAEPGHIELTTVRNHEKAAHIIMQKCFNTKRDHEGPLPSGPA